MRVGENGTYRALSAQAIRRAAQRGANVIGRCRELVNSGYVLRDKAGGAGVAEAEDGLASACGGAWRASWMWRGSSPVSRAPARWRGGQQRGIDRCAGVRAIYRKAHLWHEESTIFTAGGRGRRRSSRPRFGRLAVMIHVTISNSLSGYGCRRWPALSRRAPVNWALAPRRQGERPAEMVKAQANAAVNRLFIAPLRNERGVAWIGGSRIVDADGYPLTQSLAGEGMVLASMDIGAADDKHIGRHNHVHRDRRLMLY
ncbi:carbon-nitrogen hydrolase [Serratia ureilytica]